MEQPLALWTGATVKKYKVIRSLIVPRLNIGKQSILPSLVIQFNTWVTSEG